MNLLASVCLNIVPPCELQDFSFELSQSTDWTVPGYPSIKRYERLLSLAEVNLLSTYYLGLKELGRFRSDGIQCLGRLLLFHDQLTDELHARLGEMLTDQLKQPWQPSYSLVTIYPPGCKLERHQDRKACELTLSVLFLSRDKNGSQVYEKLGFGDEDQTAEVVRKPGDGVLFDGILTPHWRVSPEESEAWFGTVLFHFVQGRHC